MADELDIIIEDFNKCRRCNKAKKSTVIVIPNGEANKPEELCNCGRPEVYSKEIADQICFRLSEGESLKRILASPGMPGSSSVYRWLLDSTKREFWDNYSRARGIQAEVMFDEILDIADDGTNDYMTITKGDNDYNVEDREVTNRSKLRVESRKWYLSKVLPKKFGDKLDMTTNGKDLPVPLLNALSHNNSNKEDSGSQKEN